MKYKIYRGTKLSEALRLVEGKLINKYLYRTTDKTESDSYAEIAKYDDKYNKGSIIEAELNLPLSQVYEFTASDIGLLYNKKSSIYHDHIGVLHLEGFDVLLIPPKFQPLIRKPKIISIV